MAIDYAVRDASTVAAARLPVIVAIQTPSMLGIASNPALILNWADWVEKRGGYVNTLKEIHGIRTILDAGIPIIHSRVCHYTTIADESTVEGTKASGTITLSSNSAVFEAEEVGAGYNKVKVTTVVASSGLANHLDIKIEAPYLREPFVKFDVPKILTTDQKESLNQELPYVVIGTITNEIPVGTVTLSSGAEDLTDIVDTDYIGNALGGNGWHAFSKTTLPISRIVNLNRPVHAVNEALSAYCGQFDGDGKFVSGRGDTRFLIFSSPVKNLTDMQAAKDARLGEGTFSANTPINTWLGDMILNPEILLRNADDSSEIVKWHAAAHAVVAIARKDSSAAFLSAAEERFKYLPSIAGLTFNPLNPAFKVQKDLNKEAGMNFSGMNPGENTLIFYGNRSLYGNNRKILKFTNVCDLVMDILNRIRPLRNNIEFKPGHPDFYRRFFQQVSPIMNSYLPPRNYGLNSWEFFGDQDAGSLQELTFNSIADVQNGQYKFRIVANPIVSIENVLGEIITIDGTLTAEELNLNVA